MDRRLPRELLTAAEHLAGHKRGQPFKAAADPEIRAFIDRGLMTMGFRELAAAARAHFGRRAPSRSAVHRYWLALPSAEKDRIRAAGAAAEAAVTHG